MSRVVKKSNTYDEIRYGFEIDRLSYNKIKEERDFYY